MSKTKMPLLLILFTFMSNVVAGQPFQITEEMMEYSSNSITGVYLCTPSHVEAGDCSDVDQEYYDNLARLSFGSYDISRLVINGETYIGFKGGLSAGSSVALISVLEENKDVDTILLSSAGGDVFEAENISQYIISNNLNTWVPTTRLCLSACAHVFLSGMDPILDGQLGIHTMWFELPDLYSVRDLNSANETIENIVYDYGIHTVRRLQVYVKQGIDALMLEGAILNARGDFLIFRDIENLINFDPQKNHVIDMDDVISYAEEQEVVNFNLTENELLFTIGQ